MLPTRSLLLTLIAFLCIAIVPKQAMAKRIKSAEAKIKSIDVKAKMITVVTRGNNLVITLDVTSKTLIKIKGAKGTLSSLSPGLVVFIEYNSEFEFATKIVVDDR